MYGALGGSGIVATLFIIGLLLSSFNINAFLGNVALNSSIFIGIFLGLLGIFGVAKRVF
jgi:hypothetical protein